MLTVLWATSLPSASHADEEDELLIQSGPSTTSSPSSSLAPTPAVVVSAADPADPADDVEAAIKEALDRLAAIELAVSRGETSSVKPELVAVRNELLDALVALGQLRQDRDTRVWLEESGYAIVKTQDILEEDDADGASNPSGARGPLRSSEVDVLKRSIEGAPFNEGKLQLIQEGIAGRTLTAIQAEALLELFSFSRDRVEVLVFLHPKLEQDEDFRRLLMALKFESDRQAVRDRLGLES